MVEEEKEAYAEAVSLTLSQDEHTRKSYDSIKNCSQAHELIKLVRELPPSRVASFKSTRSVTYSLMVVLTVEPDDRLAISWWKLTVDYVA